MTPSSQATLDPGSFPSDTLLEEALKGAMAVPQRSQMVAFNRNQLEPLLRDYLLCNIKILLDLCPYSEEFLKHLEDIFKSRTQESILLEKIHLEETAQQEKIAIESNATLDSTTKYQRLQKAKAISTFKIKKLQLQAIASGHRFFGPLRCEGLIKLGSNQNIRQYEEVVRNSLKFMVEEIRKRVTAGTLSSKQEPAKGATATPTV